MDESRIDALARDLAASSRRSLLVAGAGLLAALALDPPAETSARTRRRRVCKKRPDGAKCRRGRTCCGDDCVNLLTAATHCGICGQACPDGQQCVHGTCTCDPFNNSCPNDDAGRCACGAFVNDPFAAACADTNSACDLDKPCASNEDCPPRSVCLRGCRDPDDPLGPNRCSNPCNPV